MRSSRILPLLAAVAVSSALLTACSGGSDVAETKAPVKETVAETPTPTPTQTQRPVVPSVFDFSGVIERADVDGNVFRISHDLALDGVFDEPSKGVAPGTFSVTSPVVTADVVVENITLSGADAPFDPTVLKFVASYEDTSAVCAREGEEDGPISMNGYCSITLAGDDSLEENVEIAAGDLLAFELEPVSAASFGGAPGDTVILNGYQESDRERIMDELAKPFAIGLVAEERRNNPIGVKTGCYISLPASGTATLLASTEPAISSCVPGPEY